MKTTSHLTREAALKVVYDVLMKQFEAKAEPVTDLQAEVDEMVAILKEDKVAFDYEILE